MPRIISIWQAFFTAPLLKTMRSTFSIVTTSVVRYLQTKTKTLTKKAGNSRTAYNQWAKPDHRNQWVADTSHSCLRHITNKQNKNERSFCIVHVQMGKPPAQVPACNFFCHLVNKYPFVSEDNVVMVHCAVKDVHVCACVWLRIMCVCMYVSICMFFSP